MYVSAPQNGYFILMTFFCEARCDSEIMIPTSLGDKLRFPHLFEALPTDLPFLTAGWSSQSSQHPGRKLLCDALSS